MNKKIEELMLVACEDETLEGLPLMEKFAELIVKECAHRLEILYGYDKVSGYGASDDIKLHFGIRE